MKGSRPHDNGPASRAPRAVETGSGRPGAWPPVRAGLATVETESEGFAAGLPPEELVQACALEADLGGCVALLHSSHGRLVDLQVADADPTFQRLVPGLAPGA